MYPMQQARGWIDSFEKRLDAMVNMLKARFPGGCHIFLANIYDPTDGTGETYMYPPFSSMSFPPWDDALEILESYNDIIRKCADRYEFVHLVNIYDEFMGHGIHCTKFWKDTYRKEDPNFWYHINIEDPNDRGYDALRRLFLTRIAQEVGPAN